MTTQAAPLLAGVIFDVDGVLVDSEPFIRDAAIRMLAENGVAAAPDDFLPFIGTGEDRFLGGVARKYGLALEMNSAKARLYEIYFEIIKGALRAHPGVREFIAHCRERNLKLALATSADRVKLDANLSEIALPMSTFDACVTGTEIERKKPAPDLFLAAAEKLQLPPQRCLVVEDAPSGIAAAKAAGARCLALTTTFDASRLGGADWFAPHLGAVPPAALEW
jgi:beta-phosphoglucomutase